MASLIPNILVSGFQSAREYLTPVLTSSQFYEKGQLTPEEFVLAGDYLIKLSPTWSWGRCSPASAKSYLPPNKQFLIIKNLPCRRRVQSIHSSSADYERDIISLHANANIPDLPHSPASSVRSIRTADHDDREDSKTSKENSYTYDDTEADEEYSDMSSFADPTMNIIDRAAAAVSRSSVAANIDEMRYYELTIVYDNYYRTPRVFLRGYVSEGEPLSIHKTMEDIMQDYVNKTATLETHPYDGLQCLSIHPCRHAATMKRIVDTMVANAGGKQPPIQVYMFLFIKFIGSMIPTIEYDNTMPVSLD